MRFPQRRLLPRRVRARHQLREGQLFGATAGAEKKQQRAENELNIAFWNLSDGWPEHDDE
jgi:hypothetical protein